MCMQDKSSAVASCRRSAAGRPPCHFQDSGASDDRHHQPGMYEVYGMPGFTLLKLISTDDVRNSAYTVYGVRFSAPVTFVSLSCGCHGGAAAD